MRTYLLHTRLIQVSVFLSLLVVGLGFFGVWGDRSPEEATTKVETSNTTLSNTKIVALGDSFTYGYPGDPDKSWTKVLAEELEIEVINKGQTQQITEDLLVRFDTDVVSEKPGRVIIFGGNGDVLKEIALEEFQTNITGMIEKAKANHITPILALPMPFPGVQKEIRDYREWMIQYAVESKIMVLDFASAMMDPNNDYLEGLSKDGKYPNTKGYKAMGEYAARVLK